MLENTTADELVELEKLITFDIETWKGLLWLNSVRDDFRHMWE